ncbi:VanZ family protein [bacterium C-53]|nr:VanZ family protein [Lachnospiraceae bacterium]NBI04046.1 VanZ family protein [Lachnospiraceae bacterium]RKJ08822.1 VanZ family protein [bacterium C-53]
MNHSLKLLSFLPMLIMMCIIFRFSAQEAELSAKTSSAVGRAIIKASVRFLEREYTEEEIVQHAAAIDGIVRKSAHMAEYAFLAFLVSIPLITYGARGRILLFLTFLIPALYASTDEFHQTFVRGRSGTFKDVLIDCVGIITYVIILKIFRRKKDFTQN